MPLRAGARMGPYEILAPLGAGGMGEVYKARDTRLAREVALKVLPEDLAHSQSRRQRFEQEARAVAALNHPNIVAIYDVGENYIVQELVDGETLRIEEPFPVRRAVALAAQIAEGLAAAHARGITHRDLKPENIMITRDGRAKILDFGIAKVTASEIAVDSATLTHEGVVVGTVGYMAPEQVRGQSADHRCDIFNVGLVLYEMLSGKAAFQGPSSVEVMHSILKDEPPDLEGVSPAVQQIVRHCLEKSPDRRFQSARDLAFALQALTGSMPQIAPLQVQTRRSRKPWVIAAVLAIVCAGAGVWAGIAMSDRPQPVFTRLTFRRGFVSGARFAPDGRTVAYSATWDGAPSDIYVARVESPDARPLGLTGAHLFAISSAGEMAIALDAVLGAVPGMSPHGTLARLPLAGGAPRTLLADVEDADWDPKGEGLAVAHVVNGVTRLEYPIGQVLYQATGWIDSIRFSPAGDRLAFADHPLRGDNRGSVMVVDVSGQKKVLSAGWEAISGVGWAPGGEVWFVAAKEGNADTLWAASLSGRKRQLFHSPTAAFLRDISADGRVLLDSPLSRNEIVWREDGSGKDRSLTWLTDSFPADLSADGRTMLFTEPGLSANYYACLRKTDGSPVVRLGDGEAESLSPDGKWVLATMLTSPPQLELIPTGAGEVQRLPRAGLDYQRFSQWFPGPSGSNRVLFAASEAGHSTRLWTQDVFPPGHPQAISGEGVSLRGNSISPDGKTVAATGPDGKLALYAVDGSGSKPVPGVESSDQLIRWSADGRSLLVYTAGRIPADLFKVDLAAGRKERWRTFTPTDPAGALSLYAVFLTPDGKSGVYSFQRTESDLKLMSGWR